MEYIKCYIYRKCIGINQAKSFNQPLTNWDISKGYYIFNIKNDMFYNAVSFNQPETIKHLKKFNN